MGPMGPMGTAGRTGIDAEDMNQVLQVEHLLHATIYRMMERDQKAHDGDLTEVWHKLHSVLIRVGEVGVTLLEVEALVLNPPKAEEPKQYAGGDMLADPDESAAPGNLPVVWALTQEGD